MIELNWISLAWSLLMIELSSNPKMKKWDQLYSEMKTCKFFEQVYSTSHLLHKLEWRTVWIFSLWLAYFRGWWTNLITPRYSYFCSGKSILWPVWKDELQFGIAVKRENGYLWSVWALSIGLGKGWWIWWQKKKGFSHIFFLSASRSILCRNKWFPENSLNDRTVCTFTPVPAWAADRKLPWQPPQQHRM